MIFLSTNDLLRLHSADFHFCTILQIYVYKLFRKMIIIDLLLFYNFIP